MSFNTVEQFRLYSFPSGSFADVPDVVIQRELDTACSEINAAVRVKHTLPLATASYDASSDLSVLYNAEITIASYRCMLWRGFKPNPENTGDAVIVNRYLEVVGKDGLLEKLAQGNLKLPMEADSTPTISEGRSKLYGNAGRTIRTIVDGEEFI